MSMETLRIRHVVIDILPCVETTTQMQDAHMVIVVVSGILLWRANITRNRGKEVRKDQLLC